MSEARSYPRRAKTDAGEIEFRMMGRADEAAVLEDRGRRALESRLKKLEKTREVRES